MDIENIRCGACGTVGECVPLGDMGSLKWFRCQACGMDVSISTTLDDLVKRRGPRPGSKIRSKWVIPEKKERENPAKGIKFVRMSLEPGWPV